jgi:hypothetical protein
MRNPGFVPHVSERRPMALWPVVQVLLDNFHSHRPKLIYRSKPNIIPLLHQKFNVQPFLG